VRGRKITMIFQEPMTSLDPLYTVGKQIGADHAAPQGAARRSAPRAVKLLKLVGIPEPERRIDSPIRTSCPAASASA
jgi:ABC-type microcin C transport system duplicated ATPase subunit YejF